MRVWERFLRRPWDLDAVQALWVLERFPSERMPDLAGDAMVLGYDGPAVLNLASFHQPTRYDLATAVDAAFLEMGRRPLSKEQAAIRLARIIASEIVAGRISPLDGAGDISKLYEDSGYPGELSDIYCLMDEDYASAYAPDEILKASKRLIEENGPLGGPGPGAQRIPG